jgi:pimeloyl-ACP methyl ester carboxylesterase
MRATTVPSMATVVHEVGRGRGGADVLPAGRTVRRTGRAPPHGYPCSSSACRNLLPLHGDRWRLVALDLPGFGYSGTPDRGSLANARETLAILPRNVDAGMPASAI